MFKGEKHVVTFNAVKLPERLFNIFIDKCTALYGDDNVKRAEAKRSKANDLANKKVVEVEVPPLEGGLKFPHVYKNGARFDDFVSDIKAADLEEEAQRQRHADAALITPAQKREQLAKLHSFIDARLKGHGNIWDTLLAAHRTDRFMEVFSQCIEDACIEYGDVDPENSKAYLGRSTINVKQVREGPNAVFNPDTNDLESPLSKEAGRIILQYRRLIAIRNCSHRLNTSINRDNLTREIRGNLNKFYKDVQDRDELGELLEHTSEHLNDLKFNYFLITKHAESLLKRFNVVKHLKARGGKNKFKIKLEGEGGHKAISKIIKRLTPAPMTCLERSEPAGEGRPKGSLTSNPAEIDEILHHAWDAITHGAKGDLSTMRDDFIRK